MIVTEIAWFVPNVLILILLLISLWSPRTLIQLDILLNNLLYHFSSSSFNLNFKNFSPSISVFFSRSWIQNLKNLTIIVLCLNLVFGSLLVKAAHNPPPDYPCHCLINDVPYNMVHYTVRFDSFISHYLNLSLFLVWFATSFIQISVASRITFTT